MLSSIARVSFDTGSNWFLPKVGGRVFNPGGNWADEEEADE
jgi:hypothetical protein